MPIYEYACGKCAHKLDALQKMSDDPLTDCPACGEPALKQLISAPNFRLKGGGWYETDFKQDKQRNVLKSDSEPDKKTSKEETGSGNGKSADGKEGDSRPAEKKSADAGVAKKSPASSDKGKAASAD